MSDLSDVIMKSVQQYEAKIQRQSDIIKRLREDKRDLMKELELTRARGEVK